jgi:hypothetical protein
VGGNSARHGALEESTARFTFERSLVIDNGKKFYRHLQGNAQDSRICLALGTFLRKFGA